ncbi:MAG: hypothetical protein HYX37_03460 [Rhizobiales bacterium]|nr:hypothetical protein [Hyphomicrobiales bacterium]
MARYTPEFLAAARHGYENTDQPMTALAADLGIGITTLQSLVRKHGWTQRSQRMRDSPPAIRLLEQARELAAQEPPSPDPPSLRGVYHRAGLRPDPLGGRVSESAIASATAGDPSPPLATLVEGGEQTPTPTLPLAGGGSALAPAPTEPSLTPVERLEALVVKELEAEEAMRAELALRPRTRHDAERCARTLSVLTQTLQTLQRMRAGGGESNSVPYDDMPEDMDAFREALAQRIDTFVESRMGKEWMDAEASPTRA